MVDINKTNLPKDESFIAPISKKQNALKKNVTRTATKDEPVRKSKLTTTFVNASRDPVYLGSLVIPVGGKRTLPNSTASAFIDNDFNTKHYIKTKALIVE